MDSSIILFILLGLLAYFLPLIILRAVRRNGIKKILNESKNYKDIENFIQIKKYELDSFEKSFLTLLGIFISVFLIFKILNWMYAVLYIILGLIFIAGISFYVEIIKINNKIIRELYILKDKKLKS